MASHPETGGEERRASRATGRLQCVVVTPERTLFDELVDFVALPLFDGELGVLPGRSPLIGRLGYGELRTRIGGDDPPLLRRRRLRPGPRRRGDRPDQPGHPRRRDRPRGRGPRAREGPGRGPLTDHDQAEKEKAVARDRAMIRVARHISAVDHGARGADRTDPRRSRGVRLAGGTASGSVSN